MKLSFRKSSPRQHLQTLHQTAVTGPDCADWDLNVAFSEWHFTLMDSTALLQVVLHLTQLECITLNIALQIEIHWTVLQWVGLDWAGLDWTGQDRTALHGTGLLQSSFMDLGCTAPNYVYSTKLCYATLCYTIPYCIVHRVTCNNFTYFAIKTIIR